MSGAGPTLLTLDIGNSRSKAAVWTGAICAARFGGTSDEVAAQLAQWLDLYQPERLGVANVGPTDHPLQAWCQATGLPLLQIDGHTPGPVRQGYRTPDTLGADRWAAVNGAYSRAGRGPLLVIDAGTAITYDAVDSAGVYHGGWITPGIRIRLDALHRYASRLPLVAPSTPEHVVGGTTHDALLNGAFYGIIGEMHEAARRFAFGATTPVVYLTGGDAPLFQNHLNSPVRSAQDLVLEGIRCLLAHNG